jgi:hypothetical protein
MPNDLLSLRDHPQGDEIEWTDEDEAAATRAWARIVAEDACAWHGVAKRSNYMALNLDANQDNADWPKRTWDLDIHTVDDLRAFLAFIGVSADQFRRSPVYRWNEDKPGMEGLRDL